MHTDMFQSDALNRNRGYEIGTMDFIRVYPPASEINTVFMVGDA